MGYISTITSPKTGVTKFKVFWREDMPNGKVIRHSKTLSQGATLKEAKSFLEEAEAKTFRKTKYSDIGKITKSVSKDGVSRFVVIWHEHDTDGKIVKRQKTFHESMTKEDAIRFLKHKERQFKSFNKHRKGVI